MLGWKKLMGDTVREYGILVTLDEQQPEAAMPLVEFWRKKAPAEKGK